VVVLLISPAPVTVVAVLYADTVLKAAGVDRIQAPSLTATIGEKSVRPPSCEDDETRVRRHEIPLDHEPADSWLLKKNIAEHVRMCKAYSHN